MGQKSVPSNFPEFLKTKAEDVKKIVEEQAPMKCIQKANIINNHNHFHIHMNKKLMNKKDEKEEKNDSDTDTDSDSSFDSDSESEVEVTKSTTPSKKSSRKKN